MFQEQFSLSRLIPWKWSRNKARWDNIQPVWSPAWTVGWINSFHNLKDLLGLRFYHALRTSSCLTNSVWTASESFTVLLHKSTKASPAFSKLIRSIFSSTVLPLSSRWVHHGSCGRTKPDSLLLKWIILSSTWLYAEYPGALVYKDIYIKIVFSKTIHCNIRVFKYLSFLFVRPSEPMERTVTIDSSSSMCSLKSCSGRAFWNHFYV